jgi:O-antigen ligase
MVVSVWVVVASASSLTELVRIIPWVATLAVFILLWPRLLATQSRLVRFTRLAGAGLALSIAIVSPFVDRSGYQIIQSGKLAIILVIIAPTLLAGFDTVRGLRIGAALAVALNAALVLAGLLGVRGAFSLMAVGRYGTFLNGPGSMWRVGILVLLPSALNLLLGQSLLWPLVLFLSSIALMIFDGSRTAGISMFLATGFIVYFMSREVMISKKGLSRKLLSRVAIVVIILIGGVIWRPVASSYTTNIGFGRRLSALFSTASSGEGIEGIAVADENRMNMLKTAFNAILDHPLLGTGMGTTTIETDVGPMVVHLAYLQIWADVGILGFIAYAVLLFGALLGPWVRTSAVVTADVGDRIVIYNGTYLLLCWAISSLLHPISTEIAEWVMFIVGLSGLQSAAWLPSFRRRKPQVNGIIRRSEDYTLSRQASTD